MFYNRLHNRIKMKYGSIEVFAKKLYCTKQNISYQLCGGNKTGFSANTVIRWAKVLEIPDDEIYDYFFAENVSSNATK